MNKYLEQIIKLADKSLKTGDVPVGAIVVKERQIVGQGYNTREANQSIIEHAEINAIIDASEKLNNWNLSDCDIYVTLKPCSMCMEVIKQSRISNVYYLMEKPSQKIEFNKTKFIKINNNLNEKLYFQKLSNFFKKLREK